MRTLLWLGLAVLLAACDEAPRGYFPLNEGLSWTYRVTTERDGQRSSTLFRIRNVERTREDGVTRAVRRTDSGTDYIIAEDNSGIYRIAKRLVVQLEPVPDPHPRYVLRQPIQPGTAWTLKSHPYVLQRMYEAEDVLRRTMTVEMAYEIEDTATSVQVPAGRFDNCVLVVGRGTLPIYTDAVDGWTDVPIISREWYAPGVGLVKLERSEPLRTHSFTGGTRTFELTQFSR
ncbi:MAG: hypothetical protein RIK00_07490 [Algiphilus sp.]|uniref:hypothetical protein n=1 Tax=Algiphilus sp. TaxID=1872431 RepID=UPI0032EB0C3B